jgi:arginyl-tRNA synthetase
MKQQIQQLLQEILKQMGVEGVMRASPELQRGEPVVEAAGDASHGEYTTNVAMTALGSTQYKNPREFALAITDRITAYHKASKLPWLDRVEVAGPGFINLFLSEASFINTIDEVLKMKEHFGEVQNRGNEVEKEAKKAAPHAKKSSEKNRAKTPQILNATGQLSSKNSRATTADAGNVRQMRRVMVEFAHPNTHKAFHIGHLRNISTGESVVRLLEAVGKKVLRVNYQGDVGMHIGKALYGLQQPEFAARMSEVQTLADKVELLGKAYAAGSKAYEEDEKAKEKIEKINKQIYQKDIEVYSLYQTTRQWSLDYFDSIYEKVGSHFDRFYFESETYESGKTYVEEGLKKGIFEKSEGAIIFPGEKFARLDSARQGLHNRVFITSEGNTTYEGKDMGLGRLQFDEYNPDLIIHVVSREQIGYFQVAFQALAQLFPDTRGREYHLVYGWVKLKHGKMSSRSGVVVLGEWLLNEAEKEIAKILSQSAKKSPLRRPADEAGIARKAAVAAVKYAFLKVGTKQEIAFDLKESVNFEGDSGPYLQYTYARCKSVIRKAQNTEGKSGELWKLGEYGGTLNTEEKAVARLIMQFPEVVEDAAYHFTPNTICTYLFHLAQAFNLFYAKHVILGQPLRMSLTAASAQVLKNGLYLLGIETLEEM